MASESASPGLQFEAFVQQWIENLVDFPAESLPPRLKDVFKFMSCPQSLLVRSGRRTLVSAGTADGPRVRWDEVPEAVTLLERAKRGEFTLHIPNVSFAEARQSIRMKCQPADGPGIHRYIRWAHKNGELNDEQATGAHRLAERYVQSGSELGKNSCANA
jgi:hypothetical protein